MKWVAWAATVAIIFSICTELYCAQKAFTYITAFDPHSKPRSLPRSSQERVGARRDELTLKSRVADKKPSALTSVYKEEWKYMGLKAKGIHSCVQKVEDSWLCLEEVQTENLARRGVKRLLRALGSSQDSSQVGLWPIECMLLLRTHDLASVIRFR